MLKKCQFEKLMIDYIANDLPKEQQAQIRAHLHTCPVCANQYQELKSLHGLLIARKRPKPPAVLINGYRLALDRAFRPQEPTVPVVQKLRSLGHTVFAAPSIGLRLAKALAILIIGIFLGRLIFNPLDIRQKTELPKATVLHLTPVDFHLSHTFWDFTEILLLQIVNSDLNQEPDSEDFLISKEIAQKLISQSLIIDEMAATMQNKRLTRFITRLQMLLYELTNASDMDGIDSLQQVRRFIIEMDLINEFRILKEFTGISQQDI